MEPRVTVCLDGDRDPREEGSTTARVVELLGLERVRARFAKPLPSGVGFAVSGASAASLALALGSSLGLGVQRSLQVAHIAEVVEQTGLGDVLAISCGIGLVFRFKAGAPGLGVVDCTPLPGSISVLGAVLKTMETREFLASYMRSEISRLAKTHLDMILENPTLESFIEGARRFFIENKMLKLALDDRLRETVENLPGLILAYVKKGVLIVLVERDKTAEVYESLKNHGVRVFILESSRTGPQVWSSR